MGISIINLFPYVSENIQPADINCSSKGAYRRPTTRKLQTNMMKMHSGVIFDQLPSKGESQLKSLNLQLTDSLIACDTTIALKTHITHKKTIVR
jgi:hypothetical protein